jgi:hypothetical protein
MRNKRGIGIYSYGEAEKASIFKGRVGRVES